MRVFAKKQVVGRWLKLIGSAIPILDFQCLNSRKQLLLIIPGNLIINRSQLLNLYVFIKATYHAKAVAGVILPKNNTKRKGFRSELAFSIVQVGRIP